MEGFSFSQNPNEQNCIRTLTQGNARFGPQVFDEEMSQSRYPPGWGEYRVRLVLELYETQSDEEAVAEDEATWEETSHTKMDVPVDLVPTVRELIAKKEQG